MFNVSVVLILSLSCSTHSHWVTGTNPVKTTQEQMSRLKNYFFRFTTLDSCKIVATIINRLNNDFPFFFFLVPWANLKWVGWLLYKCASCCNYHCQYNDDEDDDDSVTDSSIWPQVSHPCHLAQQTIIDIKQVSFTLQINYLPFVFSNRVLHWALTCWVLGLARFLTSHISVMWLTAKVLPPDFWFLFSFTFICVVIRILSWFIV